MPVLTLFSMLAFQPNAFLAFSLPLPSHHPFPSFLVVGPHRSLLSPGPLVTINNQELTLNYELILGMPASVSLAKLSGAS